MVTPYDPWRALASYPGIWVTEETLPPQERARYFHDIGVIFFAKGIGQTRRRVACCHELIHIERGDVCTPLPHINLWQERSADQAAAHRLIDIVALGDALCAHSDSDWSGVAWELWVDEDTLRTRLDHLHPSERHYLTRRLADRDNDQGGNP